MEIYSKETHKLVSHVIHISVQSTLSTFFCSLVTHWRIIYALMMREIHTVHGSSKLGYLWSIFKTVFAIAVFWFIRGIIRAKKAPHGMTILCFLAVGFIIFHIFQNHLLAVCTPYRAIGDCWLILRFFLWISWLHAVLSSSPRKYSAASSSSP